MKTGAFNRSWRSLVRAFKGQTARLTYEPAVLVNELALSKIRLYGIVLFHALILAGAVLWYLDLGENKRVVIGAGTLGSESYEYASALAEAVRVYHPDIELLILETSGSKENTQLLEDGIADLAINLSSSEIPAKGRLIAPLFDVYAQVIAGRLSTIRGGKDMGGKVIAIPSRGSGDHDLFWSMMDAYQLDREDVKAIPMSWNAARFSLENNLVDAVFALRSLGDTSVKELFGESRYRFVPIGAASGIVLAKPELSVAQVPAGAYGGIPLSPPLGLKTFRANRLLLASEDLSLDMARRITETVFERRKTLIASTRLAGFARYPTESDGTLVPIHEGAQDFFRKHEPGFLQENAEFLALLLSVAAVSGSGLFTLMGRSKRQRVDFYTRQLITLSGSVSVCATEQELERLKTQLHSLVGDIARDAEAGKISTESFEFVNFTWTATENAIRDQARRIA